MVSMLPTSLGVSLRTTGTSWATRVDDMSTRNRGSGNNDIRNVSDVNTGGAGNDADNAADDTVTGSTNGN